jgi:hypothetical protein
MQVNTGPSFQSRLRFSFLDSKSAVIRRLPAFGIDATGNCIDPQKRDRWEPSEGLSVALTTVLLMRLVLRRAPQPVCRNGGEAFGIR